MKLESAIRPVTRLRPSGIRPASSACVREIFSGRTPTSTLPPVVVGAEQRAPGSGELAAARLSDDVVAAPGVDLGLDEVGGAEEVGDEGGAAGSRTGRRGRRAARRGRAFITATVSAMVMASSWSCVTWTKVMPTSVWMRLSSSCIWRRSLRSRAPSGSSRSSTWGWLISARATATRCCWPPESWCGFLRANSPSWTRSSMSSTCFFTDLMPRRRRPKATFSKMSRCGKSA